MPNTSRDTHMVSHGEPENNLKWILRDRLISQAELARKANLNPKVIGKMLKLNPTSEMSKRRVAAALGLDPTDIFPKAREFLDDLLRDLGPTASKKHKGSKS